MMMNETTQQTRRGLVVTPSQRARWDPGSKMSGRDEMRGTETGVPNPPTPPTAPSPSPTPPTPCCCQVEPSKLVPLGFVSQFYVNMRYNLIGMLFGEEMHLYSACLKLCFAALSARAGAGTRAVGAARRAQHGMVRLAWYGV